MALLCGLHAVNALLAAARQPTLTAPELDAITAELHAREREVCPEGRDGQGEATVSLVLRPTPPIPRATTPCKH